MQKEFFDINNLEVNFLKKEEIFLLYSLRNENHLKIARYGQRYLAKPQEPAVIEVINANRQIMELIITFVKL